MSSQTSHYIRPPAYCTGPKDHLRRSNCRPISCSPSIRYAQYIPPARGGWQERLVMPSFECHAWTSVRRTCSTRDRTHASPQCFRTRRECECNRNNPGGRPIRYSSRQSQSGDWAGCNSVAPGTDRCLRTWRLVHSVARMGIRWNTDHLRRREGVRKVSTTQVRVHPKRHG
jgi:hypothetical protein